MIKEIPYGSHEEWLEIRSHYIGGSEAGAVVGMDDYASPYSLWAEKTGRVPAFEGNTITRVGSYLEDLVAQMWSEETGKKVRRKNFTMVNDLYPWACANVDRVVVGEEAILEIKTTNSLPVMRRLRGDREFPERWYCQMTHYMAVTGAKKAYLAVLVGCRELLCFEIERDEAEIDALMTAERDFWQHVTNDTEPPVDGSEATTEAITAIYAGDVVGSVELFGRKALLDERARLKAAEKDLDERIREIENVIKSDLGDNQGGLTDGWKVSWKPQERRSFDSAGFAKAHPEIDLEPYYKVSSSRPLRITQI